MSEEIKDKNVEEELSMADLMDEVDKSLKKIYPGDIVKGTIISVNEEEVMVSLGYIADGIITLEEFSEDSTLNPPDIVAIGDEIDVMVVKMDDGSGNMLLSRKRAERVVVWEDFEEFFDKDMTFAVKVKEAVKGGVVANYKGARVFIPASQLSNSYVEDITAFVGLDLKVKLIEFDKEAKKVVASRREIEEAELKITREKFMNEISIGDKRTGTVRRLADYGAFVDIGGVDGLLHISEMSFKRILHPSEVMAEGDKIEVSILDIDKAKGKISLKLANTFDNPWDSIDQTLNKGDIVSGKIVKLMPFGAFMEMENGLEGLIHISKISEERINRPADVLTVGQEVTVAVLDINTENRRISLSIVDAMDKEPEEDYTEYVDEEEEVSASIGELFKDKLSKLKF